MVFLSTGGITDPSFNYKLIIVPIIDNNLLQKFGSSYMVPTGDQSDHTWNILHPRTLTQRNSSSISSLYP